MALVAQYTSYPHEAGIDEAGRGCLAGPVVAAAVILPTDAHLPLLDDSKKLSHDQRLKLRPLILEQALAWNLGMSPPRRIDEINILHATFEAMHEAIAGLGITPEFLSIDGNRFPPFKDIPYECLIKGDGRFRNIAAASILAKTYRDDIMEMLHQKFPHYAWDSNKGYPTRAHKRAIQEFGPTSHHRRSFNWELKEGK